MNEPAVTRATMRIEYSDGRVHELDVPCPRDVQVEVTSPDLPPLLPADPPYLLSIPLPAPFWRIEMVMDATPSRRDPDRRLITVSEKPYVLDPSLAAFLDWPLYFPDESGPHCNNGQVCTNKDCVEGFGPVTIHSHRRQTIREFLADLRKHAEETI